MKISFGHLGKIMAVAILLSVGAFASTAYAFHTWGGYHWARTANPFNLKLGNNVSTIWDTQLVNSSIDWTISTALDTTVVTGLTNPKNCKAVNGRVEVCNNKYGKNGWLGIASIWISGNHITAGTVKLNDTYFNTAKYNTPAWKQFVMCQEIGHTIGLDHQDEAFDNANLGTCMDYTNDPSGTLLSQLDNQHPNAHDFEELDAIYSHLDTFTTIFSSVFNTKSPILTSNNNADIDTSNKSEWGKVIRNSKDGRNSLYERNLGKGNKLFTFVIWAD